MKTYANYAWERAAELLAIDSPSGFTAKAAAWVKEAFESYGFKGGKSMRSPRETKEERFRRLAEARVNKILHLLRLLGNLSWTGTYAYTREQVEQIFTALQSELITVKMRFLQEQESSKKRFSLSKPYDTEEPKRENKPMIAVPLPDGTYFIQAR